jgi:hypothetical protein
VPHEIDANLACVTDTVQLSFISRQHTPQPEIDMSTLAADLIELNRLAQGGAGALTEKLRLEVANRLIQSGVRDFRLGC